MKILVLLRHVLDKKPCFSGILLTFSIKLANSHHWFNDTSLMKQFFSCGLKNLVKILKKKRRLGPKILKTFWVLSLFLIEMSNFITFREITLKSQLSIYILAPKWQKLGKIPLI